MGDEQVTGSMTTTRALSAVAAAAALGFGALTMAARRRRMSSSLLAARFALSLLPNTFKDAARLRRQVEGRVYPVDAPLPASLRRMCEVREWAHDGQQVITLVPRRRAGRWHLLYLHGGAYINPLAGAHWGFIRAIIDATGASVTVPLYALAPESDHRRATAFVQAVYDAVELKHPDATIVLGGDSAGGNFALNLASVRRAAGRSLPAQLLLFSPWLDLALCDPRAREIEDDDVMLAVDGLREAGTWWAGVDDPASPMLSPLHADLAGLPPIAVFQGDWDIFVIDARTFAARAKGANVASEYHEYPGGFHVFMLATFTPESRDVVGHLSRLLPR